MLNAIIYQDLKNRIFLQRDSSVKARLNGQWTDISDLFDHIRAGSRPVQQMPMHLSDFHGDAYITVCIGQILKFLILL